MCRQLIAEQAQLAIHDPKALKQASLDLAEFGGDVEFCEDPYSAARGAHAVALLTDWQDYRDLDFPAIYGSMERPAFIFDGRNCLDHESLYEIGFNVFPVGKTPHTRL